jgi:hypothetical protein
MALLYVATWKGVELMTIVSEKLFPATRKQISSCLHRASIVSKTLFIIPTDAHYYKSVEMLKQFKSYKTCPDMFRFTQKPLSGSSPELG